MNERRKVVSVIGNKAVEEGSLRFELAYNMGKALVDNGYRVQSGGLEGIMRAVTNLITNAAKHTAPGGVVTVATQTSADGKSVTISVANPGSPIDAEHLPHLFGRFYRADASRTRQDGGTGIGLAMVASIARLHGGSVAVTSDKIKTVFSMTLPLSA